MSPLHILYVARHQQLVSNDDEGAITYAFTQLGHRVTCVEESTIHTEKKQLRDVLDPVDMVLFHKWRSPQSCEGVPQTKHCPKVCWYFDCVESFDPSFRDRDNGRRDWMYEVMPQCTHLFCTDGDWIEKCKLLPDRRSRSCQLHWLPQGTDERYVEWVEQRSTIELLYVGNVLGERQEWWERMKGRYGKRLHHIPRGVHQAELRNLVQHSKVVLAPPCPVSDLYWSNRIYLMAGFGGCVLHPQSEGLDRHYVDGLEYHSYDPTKPEEVHELISFCLRDQHALLSTQRSAFLRTKTDHLYRHRVQQLLNVVFPD